MRNTFWMRSTAGLIASATAVCLCACGSSDQSAAGSAQQGKSAGPKRVLPKADNSAADMIAAVSQSKAPRPVDLRFDLTDRPLPGQPLDVSVALIPVDPDVLGIAVKFAGEDGLALVKGAEASADKPALGVPIRRTVTVTPKADGIYALTATVTATTDTDSRTTVFSIPLIAGDGIPELAAKSAAGRKPPPSP